MIEMSGLSEHRGSRTSILSSGWKQRLALGCAVLHEPPIIFLDEPTSGVDPISRRRFWNLIYELAGKGITIFVTTHYMDEAEYCDRLAMIYRGELVSIGTPEAMKSGRREDILEVQCSRPHEAMDLVAAIPGVKEVALFGSGLHVSTDSATGLENPIQAVLTENGFSLDRIEKIPPTMEDVFVSLIETRDQAGKNQGEGWK